MDHSSLKNSRLKQPKPLAADRSLFTLDQVSFWYSPSTPLFRNFNWQLRDGESWAILGPSGSGKTTLLYLLAGLRFPQEGAAMYQGQKIASPLPEVGLMLQDYGLLPWFSARKNIEIGMKIQGVPDKEARKTAQNWLNRLEIQHIGDQYPGQLSGGQRQRVALARLLSLNTRILLMDEPFSAVDELTRERLQKLLWQIQRDLHAASIIVTHNVEEAALLGDKIMIVTGYAPIEAITVLENPFAGELPLRSDPVFIQFCSQIRGILQL